MTVLAFLANHFPLAHLSPAFSLPHAAAGFAVGLLVGLTGVGGGSLMTPLLVLVFRIPPVTAIGTDLLYAAVTKAVGTLLHGAAGAVDWRVTARLAAGSVPATLATLAVLGHFGLTGGPGSALLSHALGLALILTSAALLFRGRLLAWGARALPAPAPRRAAALTVATGAVLGVLVPLSSVGAGAVGVTALLLLYPRLPLARVVGSDIAHAVPLTLAAGAGHWLLGSVDPPLLGALLAGSIPGITLGSRLAARLPERLLRHSLAGILVLVGGRLLA